MNLDHIDSIVERAKLLGVYTRINVFDTYCNLIKINNENHILHIPDSVTRVEEQAEFRKTLRRLSGRLEVVGGNRLFSTKLMFGHMHFDEIDISGLNMSNVTNMQQMFTTSNIKKVTFGKVDTSKVISMFEIFNRAIIDELDLSTLNTSSVKDLHGAFSLSSINKLNLSGLDFNKVLSTKSMFYCSGINELNLRNINMSNVKDMRQMFCLSDTREIDVSSISFRKAERVDGIFNDVYDTPIKIKEQDFKYLRTFNIDIFHNCKNIQIIKNNL